jgi:hypothetical protein
MHKGLFGSCALLLGALAFGGKQDAVAKPKVRAITAFTTISADNYSEQLESTAKFLKAARAAYQSSGFTVETIRIATQPFPEYTRDLKHEDALALLRNIDALAQRTGFRCSIGPAMINDNDDTGAVDLLADVLSGPSGLNSSIVTAADDGIHWKALQQSARLIKAVSARSVHGQGNFNFAAISMLKPYGPFFPGAYHVGEGHAFSVGLEGANVVAAVFAKDHDPRTAQQSLTDALTTPLVEAERIAQEIASENNWTYAGIDPTPAPMADVSIGRAMESFTGAKFGSPGTMTAAAIITRAVQSIPVKRVGYSGLMIPVLEDVVLEKRWAEHSYTLDSLLAYSAVCAGGIDTVPLPGDISEARLAQILSDVATLAYKWHKPLAARLLPVPGRKAGDQTEFNNSAMGNTTIQ